MKSFLILSALMFGFVYTLLLFYLWIQAALAPGNFHCVAFSDAGWQRWIEWNVEPYFLGGVLLVELWAIMYVIKLVRAQLRKTP